LAAYVVTLRFVTRVAELHVWVQAPEKHERHEVEEEEVQGDRSSGGCEGQAVELVAERNDRGLMRMRLRRSAIQRGVSPEPLLK
jgi:hypothetical protein